MSGPIYNFAFLNYEKLLETGKLADAESLFVAGDAADELTIGKGTAFDSWLDPAGQTRLRDDKLHSTADMNRAYLHYVIDCWLDSKPLKFEAPHELAEARLGGED